MATVDTFDAILKEFYMGPVQEQLNQEIFVLETFEKAVVDWNGKHCIIPVHTDRNSGVGFRSDGADVLPVAADQSFGALQVKAKFQYGRFQVTGPAISSAAKGSSNSFISYVDAEMNHLVEDVRNNANSATVTGGRVKGFITFRGAFEVTGTAVGGQTSVFAEYSDPRVVSYDGDFTPFANCATATVETWVRVELVPLDTYTTFAGTGTNLNVFVTDTNSALGTLDLRCGNDDAVGVTNTLAAVADPSAIAVMLASTAGVDGVGTTMTGVNPALAISAATALTPTTTPHAVLSAAGDMSDSSEITGIFGNIADPSFFTVTRSSTANTALLSTAVTCNTGNCDAGDATDATAATNRAALSTARMQAMLDEILRQSGTEPDLIMMNPLMRQQYSELLLNTATAVGLSTSTSGASKGNAGYTGFTYAGIPIETSRACPSGAIVFLKKDTWKIAELESAGFADLDGNVLSRVSNHDTYEGYYRWYWNLVCTKPNANGVLVGITLP